MSQAHVLVVDDDRVITKRLEGVLQNLGYQVTAFNSPVEALRWLRVPGNQPNLIISDLEMPEMSGHDFIRLVRADSLFAHIPIVLLTSNDEIDNKVAGFEAGADDYLVKTINGTELQLRIKVLLNRAQASLPVKQKSGCKVIAVFSLRGGVGTTSLAINLSAALAQVLHTSIPLLDLALQNGNCSLMLNQKPNYTITNLATWGEDIIEAEAIEQLLINHQSGIKLLSAPLSAIEAELITPATIDRIWTYLRAKYPFLIVDAGSNFAEPALTIFERAHAIMLLVTPEMASLRTTVDAIHILEELGCAPNRILPIVNHTFSERGVSVTNIETTLQKRVISQIPYDSATFIRAINSGNPFVTKDPKAKASQAIIGLASQLSGRKVQVEKPANAPPLVSWARKFAKAT